MYTQVFVCICNTGSTSDDKIWVGLGCPQVRTPPDSLHFPPPPSPPSPPLPKFTKNLTKFLILPPSSQVSFEGCQGEQSLTKNILFSLRCSFTGTDKIFLVLHEKKKLGTFPPWHDVGHCFILASLHLVTSCARKETISSLSSLKVVAQEAYCVPDDLELVWWLAVLATPTLELKFDEKCWKVKVGWPSLLQRKKCLSVVQDVTVFLVASRFCASRFSPHLESCQFLCPPMLMPMPSHFLMQTQTRKTMHLNFTWGWFLVPTLSPKK